MLPEYGDPRISTPFLLCPLQDIIPPSKMSPAPTFERFKKIDQFRGRHSVQEVRRVSSRRFAQCPYQPCAVRSITTPDTSPCDDKWMSFVLFTEIGPRTSHLTSIATYASQSFPSYLILRQSLSCQASTCLQPQPPK